MTITNRNLFGDLLSELRLDNIGIEIGVATGNYSEVLLSKTKLKKIYFVDPWKEYSKEEYNDTTNCAQKEQDNRYNFVVKRLSSFGDRAVVIRKDSIEALVDFQDNYFDFIYIDANHAYEYVKTDLNNWYPKLKIGGIFAGHDYVNVVNDGGVWEAKKAVDEFCKNRDIKTLVTGGTRRCPPSWYFIKNN